MIFFKVTHNERSKIRVKFVHKIFWIFNEINSQKVLGPILESTGIVVQKNDRDMLRKGKVFGDVGKNVQSLKILWEKSGDLLHAINC